MLVKHVEKKSSLGYPFNETVRVLSIQNSCAAFRV